MSREKDGGALGAQAYTVGKMNWALMRKPAKYIPYDKSYPMPFM